MNQLLNKWRNVVLGLSFVTAAAGSALAAEPLVDAAWAKANAGKQGVVFIDFQPATDFMRGHIPGAVNSNFAKDGWRAERASDKVPDMLGEPGKLAELIGKLGIDNDTHVVMVPPGSNSTDMGIGTRIYWTFKVLGHDNVSLLDGGMVAYTKDKTNPLETGAAKITPKTFKVNFRKDMIAVPPRSRQRRSRSIFART